jgi:hypothetical protein
MQDRTYSDLLFLVQSLIGAGNLTSEEQGSIDSFINRRAHEAFQTSQSWPRFLIGSEERRIVELTIENAAGTNGSTVNGDYYLLGSVTGTGVNPNSSLYYISSATEVNNSVQGVFVYQNTTPAWVVATGGDLNKNADGTFVVIDTGTARYTESDNEKKSFPHEVNFWTAGAGSSGRPTVLQKQAIPYAETNRNNIGEFLKVHRKKAYINDSTIEYNFFVDSDGGNILNITNTTDSTAFVTYKKELPQYTITSTDIPGEWFFFIAHGSYADFLRMEGQIEKALIEEETAQKYLAMELEKVDNMSNNNVFRRFSTHGTRQSR